MTDSERKTVERIADLVDRFKGGDTAVWRELARQLTKHEGTTRAAALAHGRARPPQFHYPDAHQDAQRSREADAKRDVNAQAARRGMTVVPYPQVKWSAEHYTSYEIAHKKAANEVQFRDQREPRPLEGFFNKKTVAAWDTQTSALKSTLAGWEKEIGWRDTAFKTASAAREPQDAAHVARALERHTTEHAAAIAKAAPLLARYEAHKAVDTAFAGVVDRMPMPTRVAIDENKRDHYRKAPGNNIGR